jgi:hypothetical protein
MKRRWFVGLVCVAVAALAAWLVPKGTADKGSPAGWSEVTPGVWPTPSASAATTAATGTRIASTSSR